MSLWDWKARLHLYRLRHHLFPFQRLLHRELSNLMDVMVDVDLTGERVADVATGSGSALALSRQAGYRVALDRSRAMLKQISTGDPVAAVQAHAAHLPFKPATFTLVTCVGLLEYTRQPGRFFKEFHRVLKPDGLLLTTCSSKTPMNYLRNLLGHRIYPMTLPTFIEELALHGFKVEKFKTSWIQHQILAFKKDQKSQTCATREARSGLGPTSLV